MTRIAAHVHVGDEHARRVNAMVRSLEEAIGELRANGDNFARAENILTDTTAALRKFRHERMLEGDA